MAYIFGVIIVRPLGLLLTAIYNVVQSYGLAIILFALLVKIVILPISYKGKKSMLKMTAMQGKMQAIQKKYANNKIKMNEEIQKMYEAEGVNPTSGCLPSFLPLPIMMGLYYAVVKPLTFMMGLSGGNMDGATGDIELLANQVGIEITQRNVFSVQSQIAEACNQFFDKAGNLSADVAALSDTIAQNLRPLNFDFFGLDLSVKPTFTLSIMLLIPILSGLTAFLSSWIMQKMQNNGNQTQNAAQSQMKMMMYMMPLMSVYFGFQFPAAIGIYWIFNNVFTVVQEVVLTKYIRKKHPESIALKEPEGKKKKKKGEA